MVDRAYPLAASENGYLGRHTLESRGMSTQRTGRCSLCGAILNPRNADYTSRRIVGPNTGMREGETSRPLGIRFVSRSLECPIHGSRAARAINEEFPLR
jgi:hypothetical protein